MITIVRGEASRVAARVEELARGEGLVLRASEDPARPAPWGALRSFLAAARAALGDARVNEAVLPRRIVLSLALRELVSSLDEAERVARAEMGGVALGERPNVVVRDVDIYRAWAMTFGELLAGQRVRIVVPELDAIDLESLVALRSVLQALRGRADVAIVVGHDPSRVVGDADAKLLRARRADDLARLEALPITRVEDVGLVPGAGETPAPPPYASAPCDPLDDRLEARAYAALDARGAGDPDARALAIDAARAAFDSFGYEATRCLADRLLSADVDDDAACEAHRLSVLAMHNLAPLLKDAVFGDRLVSGFARLFDSARDPLARAHWGYRLTLAQGRTRGALVEARRAADGAVAAIEDAEARGEPTAPLYAAWAYNGRAYVRSREGDLDGAATDTELGLTHLAGGVPGVPEIEVQLTRMLLANNRARVAALAGDDEALAAWRATTRAHLESLPITDRPGPTWLPPPEDVRDLASTRDHQAAVVADARDRLDPEAEALAAHALGVALYKLGDAPGAHAAFATSLRIWTITRGHAEDLLTEELNVAVTAFRAGDTAAAEAGFARVRASPLMEGDAAQAETLAALAMIDAKAGARDRGFERAAEAVRMAEETGEPDVVVRTLRSAAEAHLLAGDRAGALALVDRARAAIDAVERSEAAGELPPEDVLGVLVTALDASDAETSDAATVARAVRLAPTAIADANAWWDFPRLARHAGLLRAGDDESLRAGRAALAMAVAQRM